MFLKIKFPVSKLLLVNFGLIFFISLMVFLYFQMPEKSLLLIAMIVFLSVILLFSLFRLVIFIIKGQAEITFTKNTIRIKNSAKNEIIIPWEEISLIGMQTVGVIVKNISIDNEYLVLKLKNIDRFKIDLGKTDFMIITDGKSMSSSQGDYYINLSETIGNKEDGYWEKEFKDKFGVDIVRLEYSGVNANLHHLNSKS